uniref:Reverse transcriptase Ty1/copia-type domain-containing protein n=1 Tax=Solanum lycopersicum TaxID=4081 RepID=A0A3Q7IUV8_SOLLC
MKDLGHLHIFLGVEVKYFDGGIHLSQNVAELPNKVEMTFPKTISTLLAQNHGLHEAVGNLVKASFHRMIVGIIQYLTLTRPYFTHSVKLASQFKQNPNSAHLQGVKRILRLYGYSDADWRGCTTTRRSTTAYSIYLGANCISWTSKKQSTVARSSAEVSIEHLPPVYPR